MTPVVTPVVTPVEGTVVTPARHDRSPRVARRRRLAAGAALAATGLLVSGCGDGVPPGVAAEVGETSITVDEVDDLASMICQIDVGSGQAGSPLSTQRTTALNLLLQIELGREIGDVEQVPQEQVSQALQGAAQARELVDEDLQDYFDEIVTESTRSAAALEAIAVQNIVERGEQPSQENVPPEVGQLQADYFEETSLEVDPRFGQVQQGQVVGGDGSISVPVSETALGFAPQQGQDPMQPPQPSGDLPASQVCG